ncbi:transglutaminase family protein [Roseicyclus persicicus]|uniref:Transglutaminase family protein n=1 Tax=Roseicyclus persicicus TaxID=2650661 RepID=A0A7X6JY73_9RHOB|nr:transglutaminase family protein [Roseibacterium persicicum]NKX45510.1 transglutaminase family protein [Roseibacterium persicicum]
MRYDIRLSIGYRYGAPSDHARTVARLLPSDLPGRQVVTSRHLAVDPVPAARRDTTDFFGNTMSVLTFDDPIDRIEFTLQARVERLAAADSLDLSPCLGALAAELSDYRGLDPASPHHFLGASRRVGRDPAITAFATALADPRLTVRQTVEAIATAIHDEMRFDPTATTVDTPPAEAFANRHGVCQDFSHVAIAALRALGIPAGYVSGFLRTIPPPGQPRLEGADAMHAWVSAWCGSEAGWIEVDPTNACVVGTDHIAVAHGRDYADIVPVKGVLRTSGAQTSHQSVDVVPI